MALASLASFPDTDSGADGVCVVCDVRWDTVLRATVLCFGLATCFGASTMTPGSEAAEPVAACAVPPRPHSNSIDTIATAGLAAKIDENLMAVSSQNRDGMPSWCAR